MSATTFRLKDGDKNFGVIYLPKHAGKDIPVIIFCHGWGCRAFSSTPLWGSERQVKALALKNNIAFVSFDNFAYGFTKGDMREFSSAKWMDGLDNVFEYLIEKGISTRDKIGCFAISSGTTAAFRLEGKSQKLAFIVSVATCISNNILVPGGPKRIYEENKEKLLAGGAVACGSKKKLYKAFYEDETNNNPIDSMDKIACPVFFLQGGADNKSRNKDALDGHSILSSLHKRSKYFSVEGGNHGLDNRRKICAEQTINFVLDVFKNKDCNAKSKIV